MSTVTQYPNCNCCGGGEIDNSCCTGIPQTLFGTVSGKSGSCTCIPDTITFNYDSGAGEWVASTGCGGGNMRLKCVTPPTTCQGLKLTFSDVTNNSPGFGCTCSPINLTWVSVICKCDGVNSGAFALTVTE